MGIKRWVKVVIILSIVVGTGFGQGQAEELFTLHQEILTTGACDWESFTINNEAYLVVANQANDGGASTRYFEDSYVYKWNGESFFQYQTIPTVGAVDWESFEIDGITYLVVAHSGESARGLTIDSIIYRWNEDELKFEPFQSILTQSAWNWESFEIDGTTYLAVANRNYNGITTDIDSKIYKWNGTDFSEFQSILTHGATAWESFVIDGITYLMVANMEESESVIYKWNGVSFELYQEIPTPRPIDLESFQINGTTYLAAVTPENNYGFTGTRIYKWNGTLFDEFQTILANGIAWKCESFNYDGATYIALSTHYDREVVIFKFTDTEFVEEQRIDVQALTTGMDSFEIDGNLYLAVASYEEGPTRYYQQGSSTRITNSKIYVFTYPDTDGDSVPDQYDICGSTPIGEIVDPLTGCSINQLCPCDGPVGTTNTWKNHGKYVSCIAKSSESFVELGLITEYEKDLIVSDAAQSECGVKK